MLGSLLDSELERELEKSGGLKTRRIFSLSESVLAGIAGWVEFIIIELALLIIN